MADDGISVELNQKLIGDTSVFSNIGLALHISGTAYSTPKTNADNARRVE
jgi:hypothetical protein